MSLNDLAKYFIHGIAFSIIIIGLFFLWAVILVMLVAVGFLIGLIIGLVLLLLIIGGLNSILTNSIWLVRIRTSWWNLLGHGILLSVLLFVAEIPGLIINLMIPSLATVIGHFVVYSFIDGWVARKVADMWKEEYRGPTGTKKLYPTTVCPACKNMISEDYNQCPWCSTELPSKSKEEILPSVKEITRKSIECTQCGKDVLSDFKVCPYCGWELPSS